MNEWVRKLVDQLKGLWGKWSATQKLILFAVLGAAVLAIFLIVSFSAAPAMVPLIGVPIKDEDDLARIVTKLDEEGAGYQLTPENRILVADEKTARRMRAILIREDLIPPSTDPWAIFDVERWTLTDFERDVNLRRAITSSLEQHVLALEDVDAVSVTLVTPERELFAEDQKPVTASVIVTPRPGSDFRENRKKIEGVEKLIQFAVGGLSKENIVITDQNGIQLNNFADLQDVDRIEIARREIKTKADLEQRYKAEVFASLKAIYGPDRVQIVKLDIDLDMSKRSSTTEEHFPVTMVPDNPRTPFSEREVAPSITLSREAVDERFEGTGFNPEGPPGQEGQTPPAYKDLSNLVGKYQKSSIIQNEAVNKKNTTEEQAPWRINRITTAVALDGLWKRQHDARGQPLLTAEGGIDRQYIPVPPEELLKAKSLVQDAIGFNRERGDSVTVEHVQFDRNSQFFREDAELRRQRQLRNMVLSIIIGVGAILLAAVVYRLISKEMERRRRLREEELARQHQAMREAALRRAEEEGVEVELSVEDRARLEMQENAINMAREHPEDVAQLIRTWLVEE
jgi:flagellar M-ring protein FliF